MSQLMDGKFLSEKIKESLKEELLKNSKLNPTIKPCLAVILVGDNPASLIYVAHKQKACVAVGIESKTFHLPKNTTEKELLKLIKKLNEDDLVDGILVQLPLPKHINTLNILEAVSPIKDVDGLSPVNQGLLTISKAYHVPCTPLGIITLLEYYKVPLDGAFVCVMGRSQLVGLPVGRLLCQRNATVAQLHSHTKNPKKLTNEADILVVAVGQKHLVDESWIKKDAVVIDVGINRTQEGKITGDVDFDSASKKASLITPVPGGVGPMTIASLLSNTYNSFVRRKLL